MVLVHNVDETRADLRLNKLALSPGLTKQQLKPSVITQFYLTWRNALEVST